MTRLLIQCQGSPGPLSFKMTQARAGAILHHYLTLPLPVRFVVSLMGDNGSDYYIDLATVSWICVTEETNSE